MSRRRKSKKRKPPRIVPKRGPLLVIDNAPIRKKTIKDCRSLERQIARVRAELEIFQMQDLPAFHSWEAATLGALMSEVREVQNAHSEKEYLLSVIHEYAFLHDCSMAAAYHYVMQARENPESAQSQGSDDAWDKDFDDDEDFEEDDEMLFGDSNLPPGMDAQTFEAMSRREQASFREFYDQMGMLYEAMTGNPAPNLDKELYGANGRNPPGSGGYARKSGQMPAASKDPSDSRLQSLYRQIARQLHPDANPDAGPRERELWHETQEAYARRDLEHMEAIFGRIQMGATGNFEIMPISVLRRMAEDFRSALRGLKSQVRSAKQHPAWKFASRSTGLSKLEREMRSELEDKKKLFTSALQKVTRKLEALARQAAGAPKTKRRGPPVSRDQMDFAF